MKNLAVLVTLLAGSCMAQDWLTYGGDPQRTNWQKYERDLNKDNVKNLRLLWKRQLDNQPDSRNALTAPLILGPTITHRGIKELVFVAGASDNIYAVDADLGRLFWKRHIDTAPKSPCGLGLTATPVLAPLQTPKPRANDDDPVQMRPLYVLASDGSLHTIRISTGLDMAAPVKFLPPNAAAQGLTIIDNVAYAATSEGCSGVPNGPLRSRSAVRTSGLSSRRARILSIGTSSRTSSNESSPTMNAESAALGAVDDVATSSHMRARVIAVSASSWLTSPRRPSDATRMTASHRCKVSRPTIRTAC